MEKNDALTREVLTEKYDEYKDKIKRLDELSKQANDLSVAAGTGQMEPRIAYEKLQLVKNEISTIIDYVNKLKQK